MLWVLITRIKTHQRVVHNFPFDLSQNCLFMAFKPLLRLNVESDQLSVLSLIFFVFKNVGESLGVPAKARTCLLYIGEGAVTFPKVAPFRYHFWQLIQSMVQLTPIRLW